MTDPDLDESRPKVTHQVIMGLLFGGAGAVAGFLAAKAFGRTGGLGWSDLLALILAVSLVGLGIVQLVLSRISKRIRSYSGRILPAIQRQFVEQGLVMLLAGVMLAMPVFAPFVAKGTGTVVLFGALLVLFAVQTWLNLRLWKTADEFYKRALLETSAVCFWVLQGALFLWAAAEHFGLMPALSTWDCVTVMMSVYLVLSGVIARRLGVEA